MPAKEPERLLAEEGMPVVTLVWALASITESEQATQIKQKLKMRNVVLMHCRFEAYSLKDFRHLLFSQSKIRDSYNSFC